MAMRFIGHSRISLCIAWVFLKFSERIQTLYWTYSDVLLGSEWPIGILYRPQTCVLAGQQRQDVESKLGYHWSNVVDGGQTLNQHLFNDSLCQLSVVLCASGTDWPYRQTRIPLDNHKQPALFQCWHTPTTLAQHLVRVAVLGLL